MIESIRGGRWRQRYTLVGLCFLAVFVCYIDRVNLSVAVLAMQNEFGWSATTKGLVLSSFFVGYMVFQVVAGWLANRYGGRRVLVSAVLWWSLWTMLTPAAAYLSLPVLIAARIALGLGEAATFPAIVNLYGRWIPPGERARAVTLMLSGIPLGTLFALTTTGWLVTQHGWPSVFYVFGLTGVAWAGLWLWRVHDDPGRHPGISAEERALLSTQCIPPAPAAGVPWRRLLGRAPMIALMFNHFCSNWALYVLLAWLPSYFREAQGVSLASAGMYSAAPWLTMFVVATVAGTVADGLRHRGFSTTAVRKVMQSAGLLGSALFLLLLRDVDDAATATLMLCAALGALAFTWAGYASNHLDIAPRYADVLIGVTNTFGTIPGIIGVAVTGWLVDVTGSYDSGFLLVVAVNVAGALVWLLWSTGERIID